jgi:multidrug efflux pump
MGGQFGALFKEFAITLSAAVMISLVISLTTTPMMCAWLLKPDQHGKPPGRVARFFEKGFDKILKGYEHSLDWALSSAWLVMLSLVFVIGLNVYLFAAIPKGGFPQQDTGQVSGGIRADQSISFQAMQGKLRQLVNIIKDDPDVATVVGFTGGRRAGGGFMFINLKPASERTVAGNAVIARLRPKLAKVTGVSLFLSPVQDLRSGGRSANANNQYTLKSDNEADLKKWATRLADAMKAKKSMVDVDSDQAENGVETYVTIDKDSASRLGVSAKDIDNALYNSFGQRQVATIYGEVNQYHVIMEVARDYSRSPESLKDVYVPSKGLPAPTASNPRGAPTVATAAATTATTTTGGASSTASTATAANVAAPAVRDASSGSALSTTATTMVPLSALARFAESSTATSINHQDGELATTIAFNLADGASLSDAAAEIAAAEAEIGMPNNVRGSFAGAAKTAQDSNKSLPLLILAAIVVIYIVLGILYESLVHPVTVLTTLPSAGVGAVLALLIFKMEFSTISLIGIFLLIGIVKKNAILIIDFALEAERSRGLSPLEAVREACLLRFRPILMTTLAAALGALPLAIGFGEGSELRRPLGVAIIGGLIASQLLTLLTTPVVYILMDKLRRRGPSEQQLSKIHSDPSPSTP